MQEDFLQILNGHGRRYPFMEPQDYGKLAYQSEFGPRHLAEDKRGLKSFLAEEWRNLSEDASPVFPEPVGGGFCRFPLSFCRSDGEAGLLADLFILTARESHGTMEGLKKKLGQMKKLEVSGMGEWIARWEQKGCPPARHSKRYKDACNPHYRLVKREHAFYFTLLREIRKIAAKGKPAVISIDGRCGSGKSRLAELIGQLFPCNILHMDDFYLPPELRADDWRTVPGGNMDFKRFQEELLIPIRTGREALYRPYLCQTGRMGEEKRLSPRRLTVVEGSYSRHPALAAEYDLTVFLTCPKKERQRRLKAREGSYFSVFEELWIPLEEEYLRCFEIEGASDFVADTEELGMPCRMRD